MATLLLLNSPNESKVSSDFTGKWSVRVSSLNSVAKANIPPNSVINKVTFECEMKRSGLNLSTSNTAIEVYWSDNNKMNAIGGYLLDQNSAIPTSYKKFTVDMTSSFHSGDELAGQVSVSGATYLVFCSDGVAVKDHYVRNVYITVDYTPPMYYLDINGWIDGKSEGDISKAGTADVYINGSLASNDCTDYYTQHYAGTTYEIKDIVAKSGYRYDGVRSGSLSGTINAATNVILVFSKANVYSGAKQAGVYKGSAGTDVYISNEKIYSKKG